MIINHINNIIITIISSNVIILTPISSKDAALWQEHVFLGGRMGRK